MFGTKHISTAYTGSYKSTPSIALILASNVAILSWSISLDDFVLWDSLANTSTIVEVSAGIIVYTNVAL
jgi:hypothetical protein